MSRFWNGLRPASFRGVSFDSFEQHTESGGRRLVRHEFPLRDIPYAEDLGRKAGQWQVEAFILRNRWADYEAARDKLRDALNAAGPGTLIHPWLGQMQVCVDGYTVRESTREGGYCQFSVTFVESGSLIEPDIQKDTAAKVEEAVNGAETSALDTFLSDLNMLAEDVEAAADYAEGMVDKVVSYLNTGSRVLSDIKATVRRVIAIPDRLAGTFYGLVSSVMGFDSLLNFSSGSSTSSGGGSSGASWMNSVTVSGGNAPESDSSFSVGGFDLEAFTSMISTRKDPPDTSWSGSGSGTLPPETDTIETRVYGPLIDYVAAVTVTEMGRLVADTEYATADDAIKDLQTVAEAMDIVQAAHCSDSVYAALDDLRAALADDVMERGAKLPRLGTTRLPATMPALVASYRLYGTAEYADEIVSRNNIRHPGRVPGGVALEIVRHDNA